MTTFFLVLVLLIIAMAMLSVSILFKKNGKFPETHIEDNKHLKKYGITCASNDEYECACSSPKSKSSCEGCSISSCTIQNQ